MHSNNQLYTVTYVCPVSDDATDSLFSVVNSGADAGRISVTGNIDRETDAIHTMNVRVSSTNKLTVLPYP